MIRRCRSNNRSSPDYSEGEIVETQIEPRSHIAYGLIDENWVNYWAGVVLGAIKTDWVHLPKDEMAEECEAIAEVAFVMARAMETERKKQG